MPNDKLPREPLRLDVQKIRTDAREHMGSGAITAAYQADRERVISVLNEALASEIVCVLRYKNHHFMAAGIHALAVAQEFLEHAAEEQAHADSLAARINQLGGIPNYNPEGLVARSHSEYREGTTIEAMIRENLVAERIAIETYAAIARWIGDDDSTTRRLIEGILTMEEEHADDLANLLKGMAKG